MSKNLRNAVANVLVNASNYPEGVSVRVLGRDMTELIDKVEAAVDSVRMARYHVRVHAANRYAAHGVPVQVLAADKDDAVSRAISLAWTGYRGDARVTIDRIEDET